MFTHGNQLIVTGLPMKISLLSLVNSWKSADCRIFIIYQWKSADSHRFTYGNQLIATGTHG